MTIQENENTSDKALFDQIEYNENYFHDPNKREEARKMWMDYSVQKINQHIVYSLGLIGTFITMINVNIPIVFKRLALLNIILSIFYMFTRIVYWSVYHDYSINVAPKKPKKLHFSSQDNLLNRYKWAVDYRMGEPETPRQKFAKFVKSGLFKILFLGLLIVTNLIFIHKFNVFNYVSDFVILLSCSTNSLY